MAYFRSFSCIPVNSLRKRLNVSPFEAKSFKLSFKILYLTVEFAKFNII